MIQPVNDHDRVVRFSQWKETHEEKTHPDIATEIRELRGTLNKILLAIMGLMLTVASVAVGYTLNNVGG